MKLLVVSRMDRYARAINTITNYVKAGMAQDHEVAIYGEQTSGPPSLPHSLEVSRFDFAIFVVYDPEDFPDLPYLARILDGMPKARRAIIDCTGRYNDTIRIEHDFNHLQKLDGHQDWEWNEGFEAVADKILQPTLHPLKPGVRPFLFHAYDPAAVARPYNSAHEAAQAWSRQGSAGKPYGMIYLGNNWQRWTQTRRLMDGLQPLRGELGPMRLAGWGWDKRPDWAVELGLQGVDTDPAFLERLGVETKEGVPFDGFIEYVSQARFCPVMQRPLFNHLGLVTNRTFETFCADTMPLLMLPESLVEAIHGPAARLLAPGEDVTGRVKDMLRRPEVYWDAVLKTRAHLAERHSFRRRFQELLAILKS
jgi:hypothetical protein